MNDVLNIETEQVETLIDKVDKLRAGVSDLRPMFEQFASDFYKDEKRIFNLQSPGKYQELDEKYENIKLNKYGFVFPILFATGRLAASLLSRRGRESVAIIKRHEFEIGTKTPYAIYHHSKKPRTKIPRRPLWFFGEKNNQLDFRWKRIADTYLNKMAKGLIS